MEKPEDKPDMKNMIDSEKKVSLTHQKIGYKLNSLEKMRGFFNFGKCN